MYAYVINSRTSNGNYSQINWMLGQAYETHSTPFHTKKRPALHRKHTMNDRRRRDGGAISFIRLALLSRAPRPAASQPVLCHPILLPSSVPSAQLIDSGVTIWRTRASSIVLQST